MQHVFISALQDPRSHASPKSYSSVGSSRLDWKGSLSWYDRVESALYFCSFCRYARALDSKFHSYNANFGDTSILAFAATQSRLSMLGATEAELHGEVLPAHLRVDRQRAAERNELHMVCSELASRGHTYKHSTNANFDNHIAIHPPKGELNYRGIELFLIDFS